MIDLISRFTHRVDLHQSPMHADLMRSIGWKVENRSGAQIFYRHLGPFSVAKIQRPKSLDLEWLKAFRKQHKTITTYIELGLDAKVSRQIKGISVEPFAHSSTSLIDLLPSQKAILDSFSQKTRYNIVHTLKKSDLNLIACQISKLSQSQLSDFFALHADWSKQKHVIGYSKELLDGIIKAFSKSGDLHLAYLGSELVASLLILYHDSVATYWAAFASPKGYKSFAPTLLTWQAIQTAKSKNYEIFDFGGIYDPRYPKMYKRWIGFTKFKSGFNPTVISYPPTTLQLFW